MITALNVVLVPIVVVWALPLVSDLITAAKVLLRGRDSAAASDETASRSLLFMVPAHNESGQIEGCVRSIVRESSPHATVRLIVVADNCTDDTAELARAAGAEAWERDAPDSPGKPQAIQWALDQLDLDSYDSLVVIDADSHVREGYVDAVISTGPLRDRCVQTYYDLQGGDGGWVSMLAELLVASRYEGQYQWRAKAGLNAPLAGNGMWLGTGVLARCGWADEALTENWDMYTRFTLAGEPINLVTAGRLEALEPTTMGASTIRRQRWQAGKWEVLRSHAADILRSAKISLHQRVDIFAELLSPGPVAHAGIGFVAGTLLLLWAPSSLTALLGLVLLLSPLPTVAWTLHAMAHHPNPGKVAVAMLRLPLYLLWRVTIIGRAIPTYLSGAWQRSPRPGDASTDETRA